MAAEEVFGKVAPARVVSAWRHKVDAGTLGSTGILSFSQRATARAYASAWVLPW
jgi:hypothetical protein